VETTPSQNRLFLLPKENNIFLKGETEMSRRTKKMFAAVTVILALAIGTIVWAATGTGLSGKTTITVNLDYENALDLSTITSRVAFNEGVTWTYGTGANQCNLLYHDTVTLADGANTTIDLYTDAALTDAFGNALTMEAIKLLYIKNNSSDATLKVFGAATNDLLILTGTTDEVDVHPGGVFYWSCPTSAGVDTTTNENIYLEHDGTGSDDMDIDIIAMGLD